MWWYYCLWIPAVVSSIFFMSWLSTRSDDGWKWFWFLFAAGAFFQFWPWVARYTKNIVFDAILYDAIGIISWSLCLMYWSGDRFNPLQWLGVILVFVGLAIVQKGG